MNETGVFALIAGAGLGTLIYWAERQWIRRKQAKRLIKIVMAGQSCDAQAVRNTPRRPMTPAEHKIALHEQRG